MEPKDLSFRVDTEIYVCVSGNEVNFVKTYNDVLKGYQDPQLYVTGWVLFGRKNYMLRGFIFKKIILCCYPDSKFLK